MFVIVASVNWIEINQIASSFYRLIYRLRKLITHGTQIIAHQDDGVHDVGHSSEIRWTSRIISVLFEAAILVI